MYDSLGGSILFNVVCKGCAVDRAAILRHLVEGLPGAYQREGPPASEPAALAALALLALRADMAVCKVPLDFLVRAQQKDGSVSIQHGIGAPGWPTGLAVIAWLAGSGHGAYASNVQRAVAWILERSHGTTIPRSAELAHDTTLVGWPWAAGSHSWVEPTAIQIAGLKAAGYDTHGRCREGVRLLADRQLAGGGFNYGNTKVLGQSLLAQVHPTGVALLAFKGEPNINTVLAPSFAYLRNALSASTPVASLSWAIIGLTAIGRRPARAEQWIEEAAARALRGGRSTYTLSLLVNAYLGDVAPILVASGLP
jgi:hypothetical protein